MTQTILDIQDLDVCYAERKTLFGISINVEAGERFALIGHNGAGKTTLFRAILGYLVAQSGSIRIKGHQPGTDQARDLISYLPETLSFPRNLTGAEILGYFARLRALPTNRSATILDQVGLGHAAHQAVETYSKGMQQRLGLAQALLGKPDLLLLDEPTSGLDPTSRQKFFEIISEITQQGTAVLLSSHGLDEIQQYTDRVAILLGGRLRVVGTLATLAAEARLVLTIRITADNETKEAISSLFEIKPQSYKSFDIHCDPKDKLMVLGRLSPYMERFLDLEILPPGLDDIYRYFSSQDGVSS